MFGGFPPICVDHPLGEGAATVVEVPVEGFRQLDTLGRLQSERMNIRDIDDQADDFLTGASKVELLGLLDAIEEIPARESESNNLGAGGLRLQQGGGEIRSAQRHGDLTDYLGALLFHDGRRVVHQRLAESVVGADEEPAIAAVINDRSADSPREHGGVEDPIGVVRGAGLAAETGRADVVAEDDPVFFDDERRHRERDARIIELHQRVHALIEPLPGDIDADVRLVLMIGREKLDLQSPGLRKLP
jgi:hypothetical protein